VEGRMHSSDKKDQVRCWAQWYNLQFQLLGKIRWTNVQEQSGQKVSKTASQQISHAYNPSYEEGVIRLAPGKIKQPNSKKDEIPSKK
jgi:hypothetical protein